MGLVKLGTVFYASGKKEGKKPDYSSWIKFRVVSRGIKRVYIEFLLIITYHHQD